MGRGVGWLRGLTYLRGRDVVLQYLDNVQQDVHTRIASYHVRRACFHPVVDSGGSLVVGSQNHELLEKRVRQHSDELAGKLNLLQVADECVGIVDFLQCYGVLPKSAIVIRDLSTTEIDRPPEREGCGRLAGLRLVPSFACSTSD